MAKEYVEKLSNLVRELKIEDEVALPLEVKHFFSDAHNIWQQIVPATMMCRAATNHFWISATNSMARCSSWPSFVVAPDGSLVDQLPEHTDAVLISQVDQDQDYWDTSAPWRDRSINGQLHSGDSGRPSAQHRPHLSLEPG